MKGLAPLFMFLAVVSAFSQPDSFQGEAANVLSNPQRADTPRSSTNDSQFERRSIYAVKPMVFNGPGMDFSPFPYRNGIVFVSSRSKKGNEQTGEQTFLNLFFTAEAEDGGFSVPEALEAKTISSYHEGPLVFFAEGTKKIFTRNTFIRKSRVKDGSVNPLELAASEMTASGEWSEPVALPLVGPGYSVAHPAVTSDGKTLYFSSDMPGTVGQSDIFVSKLENGAWATPRNLGRAINTEGQEMFPYIYKDSLLFFASNGRGGLGGLDIFYCDLKSKDVRINTFSGPVNSSSDDFGIFVEEEGASGFFSSNRTGGAGKDDIYYFEEIQPFVEIQLYDSVTRHFVPDATISVTGQNRSRQVKSDFSGKVEFRVRPVSATQVLISATGYESSSVELVPELLQQEHNRVAILLKPTEATSRHLAAGIRQHHRSGVTNVITFSSSPLDVDVQTEAPQPAADQGGVPDSLALPPVKVIAVEVINGVPALMFVRNDSIHQVTEVSATTLESSHLGLSIEIPQGARRHDYEEIIRKQVEMQGYSISRFLLIRSFFFDSGKTWVRNDASAQLDKIIEVMVVHPEVHLQMTFHSDSRGTDAFNLDLSKARAEEVIQYLERAGIKRTRIFSRFVGESQPLNDCGDLSDCDELLHQINRTAEFKFFVK